MNEWGLSNRNTFYGCHNKSIRQRKSLEKMVNVLIVQILKLFESNNSHCWKKKKLSQQAWKFCWSSNKIFKTVYDTEMSKCQNNFRHSGIIYWLTVTGSVLNMEMTFKIFKKLSKYLTEKRPIAIPSPKRLNPSLNHIKSCSIW